MKKNVATGTITIEQVLELLLQQIEMNRRLTARVEMLEAQLARYEPPPPKDVSGLGTPTDDRVAANEQRRRGRRKKQKSVRRGRLVNVPLEMTSDPSRRPAESLRAMRFQLPSACRRN